MKNIFKKNHIIITALAIMIVIAGYLALTDKDTPKDAGTATSANPDTDEYEEFTGLDGMDVVTDTTGDIEADIADNDETIGTDAAKEDVTTEDVTTEGLDNNEAAALEENKGETEDLAESDISDEDIIETAQDVTDNGEIDMEDGVPGEAVLANTTLDPSFFISKKLDREQVRAKNKDTIMEIIESEDVSEEAKKDAINSMIELTQIAEKESATEMLLEAKGFDGAVVFIVDDGVDVVVNAATLSDQQLAIIEDVVKDKTDIAVEHININPVIVAE